MSNLYKNEIPKFLLIFVGGFLLFFYYIKYPPFQAADQMIISWASLMGGFAGIVGIFTIIRHHYLKVKKRVKGEWQLAIYTLILLTILIPYVLIVGASDATFQKIWFYLGGQFSIGIMAIQGFFYVSASWRAIKVRGWESALLLVGTWIAVMGLSPLAPKLIPPVADLAIWVINVPNMAIQRGILIGSGVGACILGIRTILGKEKTLSIGGSGGE